MSPKFKYGDRVIAGGYAGKIKSIKKKDGKYICTVLFDKKSLIPSELDYEEKYIKFENKYEEACPCCGKRWKIVKFNMKVWKDCIKCGKTQEQLVKEYYERKNSKLPPIPKLSKEKKEDDLLKHFEKMLEYDNDDDDDFGLLNIGV